jgi:hypothetical protein
MMNRRGITHTLACAMALGVALIGCGPAPAASTTAAVTPSVTAPPIGPASAPPVTLAPLPTPVDTGSAGTPPCAVADLKASHGLVDGAAGSRLTEIVLVSAVTCSIDAYPALGLRDADGAALLSGPAMGQGGIDLVPGVGNVSQVRLANWCAPEPDFPLTLEVIIYGAGLSVTGGSFPEEGDVPPCNGDGGPILEGTAWTQQP